MDLFNDSINLIREFEQNYSLGWRFLTTSKTTISVNNGLFFITLNPGGSLSKYKGQSEASCENGSAYLVENWGASSGESKLQTQIKALFFEISIKLNIPDYRTLIEESLCGYFVPYRSPNIASLEHSEKSFEIGKRIWKSIIEKSTPRIIICIDQNTFKKIKEILIEIGFSLNQECHYPTGWGNYKATISTFSSTNSNISILRLPHLSRYSIFGRDESTKHIEKFIDQISKDYLANK